MASSGFSFSAPQASSNSLFAAKTTQSTVSFGSLPSTSAFAGLGGAKTTSSFSFGAPAATSGFSLSAPSGSTPAAGGLFGAKSTATTGFGSGGLFGNTTAASTSSSGLFGAKPATSGFTLSAPAASSSSLFGATNAPSNAIGFGSAIATTAAGASNTTAAKLPENVKDAIVPAEVKALADSLEKHIKNQKNIKEEISKISSESIDKTKEELKGLKQSVALISNTVQRNSIAVENLKFDVTQELKNAEICHGIDQVSANLHHDFTAPIQYFQRLVFSFESRINNYRQEIEELEAFLTSTSPVHEFTPQDLSNILRRLNEAFVGLASELHQIHEVVKCLKEKYLHYRRVLYNDTSDPFVTRKNRNYRSSDKTMGPSPFPVVQGAGIMVSAFKTEQKVTTIGTSMPKQLGFASSFPKPTGLTRSYSFDGSATKTNFAGSLSAGGSLFGKPILGTTPSLNSTGTFTLQKPPTGKRGRII